MVQFTDTDTPATPAEVDALERRLGFSVPSGIRKIFLTANGGRPQPHIYRDSKGGTPVSQCFPLREGKGGVWRIYEILALSKKAIPQYYLPFAVDSFGNSFVVDCRSDDGHVHILFHDPEFRLCPLGVTLEEFWERLTSV